MKIFFKTNLFIFLKRTGRRAARYIKKKGARRASTTEEALNKAQGTDRRKTEIGRHERKNSRKKSKREKESRGSTKPEATTNACRPPPSNNSHGL